MYCSNCGKELPDDVRFCPSCGTGQSDDTNEEHREESEQSAATEDAMLDAVTEQQEVPEGRRYLSNALRNEYAKKLAKRGSFWVGLASFLGFLIISFMIVGLFVDSADDLPSWVIVTLFLVPLWQSYSVVESYQEKRFFKIRDEYSDDYLEYRYKDYTSSRRTAGVIIVIILAGSGAGFYYFNQEEINEKLTTVTNPAVCAVIGQEAIEDTYFRNDQFDYGITVTSVVKNTGDTGDIDVSAKVASSEGEYFRERNIRLAGEQQTTVTFQFHEPTISATNITWGVKCAPTQ